MTAVEWFFEQIMYADVDIKVWKEILEQAKEMEKQQIIKSRENGISEGYRRTNNFYYDQMIDSEQYYAKTYKNKI